MGTRTVGRTQLLPEKWRHRRAVEDPHNHRKYLHASRKWNSCLRSPQPPICHQIHPISCPSRFRTYFLFKIPLNKIPSEKWQLRAIVFIYLFFAGLFYRGIWNCMQRYFTIKTIKNDLIVLQSAERGDYHRCTLAGNSFVKHDFRSYCTWIREEKHSIWI